MNEQQLYIFNQGLKDFSSEIEFLHIGRTSRNCACLSYLFGRKER